MIVLCLILGWGFALFATSHYAGMQQLVVQLSTLSLDEPGAQERQDSDMFGYHVVDTKHMLRNAPGIEIIGDDQQMLHILLGPGQAVWAEPGTMVHCGNKIRSRMSAGGLGQAFTRRFIAKESMFRVHWENHDRARPQLLGLSADFPAKVVPVNLDDWQGEIFVKRHAFLAAVDPNIRFSFERAGRRSGGTIGKAVFAGQGLFLNIIKGRGWIFLSASGAVFQKTLADGETIVVDRSCVVAWQTSCRFSYRWTGGVGMMCCGGEGVTETTISGPGKVIMQSFPFEKTKEIYKNDAPADIPDPEHALQE